MDNNSLSHTKWTCKYHIVFTPKLGKRKLPKWEAFSYLKMPVNCHNYLRKKLFFGNNNMIYYN